MTAPLRVNAAEEAADYRNAVAEILRRIQTEHDVTLLEISERIDVSLGTISNAANKKGVLNPIYLNRLGQAFGAAILTPYTALAGGRVIPIEQSEGVDILPLLAIVMQKIASARASDSPGGQRETINQRLEYLPDLRRLRHESGALIATIEGERAAL